MKLTILPNALLMLLFLSHPPMDGSLLESGSAENLRKPASAAEIKIVSYNIRWSSGDDLKLLIKLFKGDPEIGGAAILGLQEVDRRKKRSGNSNTVKMLADELGLHYAWTAPPAAKPRDEEETGVAILSVYPLSDGRRVALGATVEIDKHQWRVYTAHAETRLALNKKLEQFKAVLQDLAQYPPH